MDAKILEGLLDYGFNITRFFVTLEMLLEFEMGVICSFIPMARNMLFFVIILLQ